MRRLCVTDMRHLCATDMRCLGSTHRQSALATKSFLNYISSMIRLHVFDIDGTVLDSMKMWDNLAVQYLENLGITPPDNIAEIIDPMTVPQVHAYLADAFHIPGGAKAVQLSLDKYLMHQYSKILLPFEDAVKELEELHSAGQRMIAFSNTPHKYIDLAMGRLNLTKYFEKIYTVEETKNRKDSPEAFLEICELAGREICELAGRELCGTAGNNSCRFAKLRPDEVLVHDDSPFALEAAETAGCSIKRYNRYR